MLPFEYILILLALILLIAGLYYMDYAITMISGFFFVCLGIWIMPNGIDVFKNFATDVLGIIFLGAGFYVIVRSNIDRIEVLFGR